MMWTYYRLLMWKNFLIKSRHKIELLAEICLPLIFFAMVLGIRGVMLPESYKEPTIYPPVGIKASSLRYLKNQYSATVQLWEIVYTPVHPFLDTIISNAASDLALGFRGLNSSSELENYMETYQPLVGVVFEVDNTENSDNSAIRNLTYRLRFPGGLRTVDMMSSISTWQTYRMFDPHADIEGAREKGSNSGGNPNYINEGFIAVQNAIALNFIRLSSTTDAKEQLPDIKLQRFPYPSFVHDPILDYMQWSVGILLVLAFMFPCVQAIKHITVEKERQLKETMKIMGLSTALHWIAWFTTAIIPLCILVVELLVVLRVPWFSNFSLGIFTRSSWSLLAVVFLVYAISCVSFSFMMSSFFKKASIAGPISALAWFITYIPYSFTANVENSGGGSLPIEGSIILSLFSNTACPYACAQILNWEALNVGAQWSNLFESPIVGRDYTLGLAVIMMVVDSILYMLIALYVEKIMPGTYGLTYKWYFPLTKSFWCSHSGEVIDESGPPTSPVGDDNCFERVIGTKNSGIQLVNLKKRFGKKVAVDGLSVKMYENQITVLLGHNGAGKTTTISMITGLIAPTSGTAYVNGYNMRKEFNKIRKSLGFCPQHNILFDELTVEEHIVFFSVLKQIPKDRIQGEVRKYIKILELEDKRKAQSQTLSGGMKRKLSMCIALCGDSKVVLCDEPSAGMDPAARRSLWNLLQNEKKGRTILLTTHLMDEADVLGDRIAIMSEGKMKCSGTPFFLKKRFGSGYKLICSKKLDCNVKSITNLIQEFIPDASIKTEVGTELIYQLPEKHSNLFESMLRELESRQGELGINGYGITMTTLEDVFLRTGTEEENSNSKTNGVANESMWTISKNDLISIDSIPIFGPNKRYAYLWRAMFFKKAIAFRRNWHLFLLQIIVPILFLLLGYFISKVSTVVESTPPLKISLETYGRTMTFLRNDAENSEILKKIEQSYISLFLSFPGKDVIKVPKKPIEDEILELSERNLRLINQQNMIAATLSSSGIVGWFNGQAFHTAPLSLNLIHNAIAKAILGASYTITVVNEPLPISTDHKLNELKTTGSLGFQIALNTTFAMAYVSSIFIMFLITERVLRSKLLQFVSGVRASVFWVVHFIIDFTEFVVVAVFITLAMFALQQNGFMTPSEILRFFMTLVLYGYSSLPFAYLFSFYFDEPATGLARLSTIHICTGVALFIVGLVFLILNLGDTLANIAVVFPNFALAQAISNQATQAATASICEAVSLKMGVTVQNVCEIASSSCCDLDPLDWKMPGNARPYVALIIVGTVIFAILILREILSNQRKACCKQPPPMPQECPFSYDEDVQSEKNRVEIIQGSNMAYPKLLMHNLTKFYDKFLAVNRVSVAVERGECFGLLGVNGAGKTSTFKMMTADESISHGNVWIAGNDVEKDKSSVYELIGYCPQYDALLMDFTGMEMLKLFAILRGVPSDLIRPLSKQLSVSLAFEKHLHKKVKEYSGGNRRKLSTAIAMLGNPHLVFLDEPTAGVDPVSRRKIWDMVCHVRDRGKAIILTSHSMEECEALCTRIAIMVNGEFKCIGSAQHLKNRYSSGITLTVKLGKPDERFDFSDVTSNGRKERSTLELDQCGYNVVRFMHHNFEGTTLKAYHKRLLTFEIPVNRMPYSDIFGLMESSKKLLNIEDYSLSQGTLEQVFLSFTVNQRDS